MARLRDVRWWRGLLPPAGWRAAPVAAPRAAGAVAPGRRDRLLDLALWVVISAPIAIALLTPPNSSWFLDRLAGSLLLTGLAVLASRWAPLLGLLLVVLPTAWDGNFMFGIPVLSYLVGLRERSSGPAALVFAGIGLGGTIINLGLLGTEAEVWFLLASTLLVGGVFPWLVGRYHRQHRALVLAGWEQADLLEREQRGAAERVRMRERARIAQDMHDSLGHDLSLIALRAGALEVAADLDERHRRAAGELRASVALATDRLRQVIGVLRDDAEPAPTRPPGERVDDIVARARAAGMAVRLVVEGESPAAGPGAAGPPMVERALCSVVQEALTNATRHAPGAAVTVAVCRGVDRTSVRVGNDRPPAGPLPGTGGAGSGLVGLRERVRLAGGTLRAGPAGGGFEVYAELPAVPPAEAGAAGEAGPAEAGHPAGPPEPGYPGRLPATDVGVPLGGPAAVATAHRLRSARRRVRRSLLAAVTVPVAIGALLVLAYYPIATFGAVLDSDRYEQLRMGQDRAELRELLPDRQVVAPAGAVDRPVPSGASCEFYSDGAFPFGQVVYRVCFLHGRLVVKDRLGG
ncbi:two-component sensor histidine kinase [Plantactinospora sp. BC1]|uniref:sensor histidine kinase n=1 Tax=Plantactinospora sp. BC1 TaxID=2108470 RepID=UPI000D17A651|nr:histidine kinase [Plantactinospora sp. BC1]AVT33006.1 two-component sensor histidine kinase [Plantactinospora sp. BC1]